MDIDIFGGWLSSSNPFFRRLIKFQTRPNTVWRTFIKLIYLRYIVHKAIVSQWMIIEQSEQLMSSEQFEHRTVPDTCSVGTGHQHHKTKYDAGDRWRHSTHLSDRFYMLVPWSSPWLVINGYPSRHKHPKVVTTDLVFSIRHQHRCMSSPTSCHIMRWNLQ